MSSSVSIVILSKTQNNNNIQNDMVSECEFYYSVGGKISKYKSQREKFDFWWQISKCIHNQRTISLAGLLSENQIKQFAEMQHIDDHSRS